MEIENRFQAVAIHPVERMIHAHASSLAKSRRAARCDEPAPACREADAGQCRIVINALRREIDRLLRGIDRFDPICHRRHGTTYGLQNRGDENREFEADAGAIEFSKLASASMHRRSYAVSPLGAPLAEIAGASVADMYAAGPPQFHATSSAGIGALLDVLA